MPLTAWRQHIVSLVVSLADESAAAAQSAAGEIATACMAPLVGVGLLLNSTGQADAPFEPIRDWAAFRAVTALTRLVEDAA